MVLQREKMLKRSKRKRKQMCSPGYVPLYLYGKDGLRIRCVKDYHAHVNAKVKK